MNRLSHNTWSTIIGVAYLGLMTNLLLIVGCLPLVALLITTNPAYSWPFIAAAAALTGPAVAAAFATFKASSHGETAVIRTFVRAWKATAWKAFAISGAGALLIVIAFVDVKMLAATTLSVVVVPALLLVAVLAFATGLLALVALSEEPRALLRDILKASLYLGLRRWFITIVTLAAIGMQAALFANMPALALGITAAPALYIAWANSRYTLRPVLEATDVAS